VTALEFQGVDDFTGGAFKLRDTSERVKRGVQAAAMGAGVVIPEPMARRTTGFDTPGDLLPAAIADPAADAAAADAGRGKQKVENMFMK
jgi:hypothetical protein